jgi:hypothetical protein
MLLRPRTHWGESRCNRSGIVRDRCHEISRVEVSGLGQGIRRAFAAEPATAFFRQVVAAVMSLIKSPLTCR